MAKKLRGEAKKAEQQIENYVHPPESLQVLSNRSEAHAYQLCHLLSTIIKPIWLILVEAPVELHQLFEDTPSLTTTPPV